MNESERAWQTFQFKQDLIEAETGSHDIKDGLEVRTDKTEEPKPMEEIDPGFTGYVERGTGGIASEQSAWDIVTTQGEELGMRQALQAFEFAESEQDVIKAALFAAGTSRYAEFLGAVEQQEGPEYTQGLAQVVSNTLNEFQQNAQEREFQSEMEQSEAANVRDAQRALDNLAASRGMSADQVERVAATYRSAVGQPLRQSLLAVMPAERGSFLAELAVHSETLERSEPLRAFKASFFNPANSRDIADGLRGKGIEPRELPPSVTDPEFNAHLVEQQVRREDAERPERPSRESADDIRLGVLGHGELDWRSGLTDSSGRTTSYHDLAAKDPDSLQNVNARARERSLAKIMNVTGGRRTG